MKMYSVTITFLILSFGCSYHFTTYKNHHEDSIKSMAIPVFKNRSFEYNIENTFTESLINEFNKSNIIPIKDKVLADGILEGVISKVDVVISTTIQGNEDTDKSGKLPKDKALANEYMISVTVWLILKDKKGKELWKTTLTDSKRFQAHVQTDGAYMLNPLVNESTKRDTYLVLAKTMMAKAHDRFFESF